MYNQHRKHYGGFLKIQSKSTPAILLLGAYTNELKWKSRRDFFKIHIHSSIYFTTDKNNHIKHKSGPNVQEDEKCLYKHLLKTRKF